MASTSIEKHKIKKKIEELKEKRAVDGHSTTLVTLIIPSDASIRDIRNLISQEIATAQNIKSKKTRKHVKSALQSIHRRLKKYREFPENGLIIYCGITQDRSMKLEEVVPPRPIQRKRYLCDSRFHTELLEEMIKRKRKYGVILIERDRATFGMLIGSKPRILKEISGYVPSKHGKGGQSQQRFERLIEERYKKFLKKTAEMAREIFSRREVEGILIGGPAYAHQELQNYLSKSVKEQVIGTVRTQYLGTAGLREALNKGAKLIKNSRYAKEKKIMDRVMELASTASNRLSFGFDETFKTLRNGRVETLVVKESLTGRIWKAECGKTARPEILCDKDKRNKDTIRDIIREECPSDEPLKVEKVSDDPVGFLIEKAKDFGTEVKLISEEGEPSDMLSQFDGIVGILRY